MNVQTSNEVKTDVLITNLLGDGTNLINYGSVLADVTAKRVLFPYIIVCDLLDSNLIRLVDNE